MGQMQTIQQTQDVDKALQLRASSLGVELELRFETKFPKDGQSYQVVSGCTANGSSDACRAILSDLSKTMAPAPKDKIHEWIAELSVLVVPKNASEFDLMLTIKAFTNRLSDYPADIVEEALLKDTWKFFPAWSELKDALDQKVKTRRAMKWALQRKIDETQERADQPITLTPEQIEHRKKVAAEAVGRFNKMHDGHQKQKQACESDLEKARFQVAVKSIFETYDGASMEAIISHCPRHHQRYVQEGVLEMERNGILTRDGEGNFVLVAQ